MHFITLNLMDSYGGIKTECAGSTDITTSFQTNTEKSKQEDQGFENIPCENILITH